MNKLKYIRVEHESGKHEIIMFPSSIDHDVMAEGVECLKSETGGNWERERRTVVSAGFVTQDWKCYGESYTLGLSAAPNQDTELLRNQMGYRKSRG